MLVAQSCPTLCDPTDCGPPGSSVHGMDSPGKITGMDCHSLLQGIFPTQGFNPGLLHWRQTLYCLCHQGSPCCKLSCTQISLCPDSSVQFSRSVVSDSLWPHESQHTRPPCPSPTPGVHSDSCPSSQWCHPDISSSVVHFSSCPQSLPDKYSVIQPECSTP